MEAAESLASLVVHALTVDGKFVPLNVIYQGPRDRTPDSTCGGLPIGPLKRHRR